MVGRALHIHDAIFVSGVGLRHELGEGSIEMDIVRHEQPPIAQPFPKLPKLPEHVPVAVRTVVQKHVDLRRQLVALDEVLHSPFERHELRSQIAWNQRAVLAVPVHLQAVQSCLYQTFVRESFETERRRHAEIAAGLDYDGRALPAGQAIERRAIERSHEPGTARPIEVLSHFRHEIALLNLGGEMRDAFPHVGGWRRQGIISLRFFVIRLSP